MFNLPAVVAVESGVRVALLLLDSSNCKIGARRWFRHSNKLEVLSAESVKKRAQLF